MKKTLLSIFTVAAISASANAQVFTPGASALPGGNINEAYTAVVIDVDVPINTTLNGSVVADPLVDAVPAAAAFTGLLSGVEADFTVSSTTLSVSGLPDGLSAVCDITSCAYDGGATGTITISGTPTETGLFTIDITSLTGGVADLAAIVSVIPIPGIPSTLPLPQPAPGIFDETGYTIFVADPNSIAEANDVFGLRFYPNPTVGDATLEINSIEGGVANIEVFSITGSRVFTVGESINVGLNRIVVDMNDVPAGIYMIRAEINGEQALIRTQKI